MSTCSTIANIHYEGGVKKFDKCVTYSGRYFILPVPNSVSGTCLCNILRHKVSQHNFHNIHLLNVDSKFRDTEYEVRSPQESPCISIDQIISGQK